MIKTEDLESFKSDLRDCLDRIREEAEEIEISTNSICNQLRERDNKALKENPYILKRILKHIANGLAPSAACDLTADELNISTSRAEKLLSSQKMYFSALNLYARRFTALRLKKAGFDNVDISKILGVSSNHVYKLLESEVNLWVLSGYRYNKSALSDASDN